MLWANFANTTPYTTVANLRLDTTWLWLCWKKCTTDGIIITTRDGVGGVGLYKNQDGLTKTI